ncbi:MAG: YjjG family noncanonical pyrimidine nucleotidase [Clostridia bacterium]|nr:YjjG family noncanonical pyrimidine nucleotidase [Clostridia bacterium]
MIKHLLIDLDQTIFDFHRAEREALDGMLRELGATPSDELAKAYSEINDSYWKMLELGTITRDELLVKRFTTLFERYGIDADGAMARKSYERRLGDCCFYIEGAQELLKTLFGRVKMHLASNGTDSVQTRRLAKAGIEHYFENIFISQRVGFDKPDVRYFERCFSAIEDFDPAECAIFGDSLSSDIKGGKNAGITTIWYNPCKIKSTSVMPDYEVESLAALPELLEKI